MTNADHHVVFDDAIRSAGDVDIGGAETGDHGCAQRYPAEGL